MQFICSQAGSLGAAVVVVVVVVEVVETRSRPPGRRLDEPAAARLLKSWHFLKT